MSENQEVEFADNPPPGYRFFPTDVELVRNFLRVKIEGGVLPANVFHEVNLYDFNPEQLTERYEASGTRWYFLTSRRRVSTRGNLPNRETLDYGSWRSRQCKSLRDEETRELLGWKRSLTFYDRDRKRTKWLMNEFTTTDPIIPVGSGNDWKMLNHWVLCVVYKNPHI